MRACEHCGQPNERTHPAARFCSERCRKRAENVRYVRRYGHRPRQGRPSIDLTLGSVTETVTDRDMGRYHDALAHDVCAYCGATSEQTEHVDPTSRGGSHDWTNVAASCAVCNASKGDLMLVSFLLRRRTDALIGELRRERQALVALGPKRQGKHRRSSGARARRSVANRGRQHALPRAEVAAESTE